MTGGSLALHSIELATGVSFQAGWIPLPAVPLHEEERIALCALVGRLEERARRVSRLSLVHEVYLQMAQIERPAGPLLLSRNGPRWLPSPGIGVWPDRDPPRSLTVRDLEALAPGEKLPEFSHQLFRINARDESMRVQAVTSLLGTGPVLSMLVHEDWGAARQRISAWLEARITEESFRGHPFYAPLLDEKSLATLGAAELSSCLDGVILYFREDTARNALLVISRIPFAALADPRACET